MTDPTKPAAAKPAEHKLAPVPHKAPVKAKSHPKLPEMPAAPVPAPGRPGVAAAVAAAAALAFSPVLAALFRRRR
jgi:hypothetical protein